MNDSNSEPRVDRRTAPWWVKAFVAFHIICITVWAIPQPQRQIYDNPGLLSIHMDKDGSALHRAASLARSTCFFISNGSLYVNSLYLKQSPLKYYAGATGFWQYWDMFAPNPSDVDLWGDAEITYKSGATRHYQYPRIYLLPLPEKYIKERFRKFYERAGSREYQYLWPTFAQRVALINDDRPGDPPVKVSLYRHTMLIEPPGMPPRTKYESDNYFKYTVDQVLLAKAKRGEY
jgi:hypothetical protein